MAMIALSRGGEKGMDATKEKGAKIKYKKTKGKCYEYKQGCRSGKEKREKEGNNGEENRKRKRKRRGGDGRTEKKEERR